MTDPIPLFRHLGEKVLTDMGTALAEPLDASILDGRPIPELPAGQMPYKWGPTFSIPRDMAVALGYSEPTPQEAAGIAASREWARKWRADRTLKSAEWFSAVRDALYPDAVAMLDLHVPDDLLDDCEACTIDPLEGRVSWPCSTVLAAAGAVGIAEPEGI